MAIKQQQSAARQQAFEGCPAIGLADSTEVPAYLNDTYWWAYVHPGAVKLFERDWLVNLILWGNFGRLRDAALDALGDSLPGNTLQIACVYGNLTQRIEARVPDDGQLDVVDVLPIQLDNLRRKLGPESRVGMIHCNSAQLNVAAGSYDRALLFFLLHEQPEDVRRATIAQALRAVKPGGRLVIVDYHRPSRLHLLYWPMVAILGTLEPYALDLWRRPVGDWMPADSGARIDRFRTMFGGLYQLLEITV